MKTVTPDNFCPHCGHFINAATDATFKKAKPRAGDVTICLYCSGYSLFKKDLTLEKLNSIFDVEDLDPKLRNQLIDLKKIIKEKNRKL